jgi:chromosome segregation ATPase
MQRRQLTGQLENYIEELTKTNEKLVTAVEKLAGASESQGQRFDQMAQNQDRFVSVFDRQGKVMSDLLAEMQRMTNASDHLIVALEALPKSSREQGEKLSAIEDQLQSDGQTDRALLTSLDSLGRHVAAMARYAETQQTNREELIKGFSRQLEPLAELLQAQNRFARWNFTVMIIGVLAILGFFGTYLVKIFLG